MKRLIIFIIVVFQAVHLLAIDDHEIEQLKTELSKSSGARRIEILKMLSEKYYDQTGGAALNYSLQYYNLSNLQNSAKDIAHANYQLGLVYFFEVDYRKSIFFHIEAIKCYKQLKDEIAIARNYFRGGQSLLYLRQFDSARQYNDSALAIYRKLNLKKDIVGSKIQSGKIFNLSSQYDSALMVFEEIIATPGLDLNQQAWVLHWLGNTLVKCGNLVRAEDAILKSIESYQSADDLYGKLGSLQLLGDIYLMKGQYADAYNVFFTSYENRHYVRGDFGKLNFNGQYFLNTGNVFFHSGNYQTALRNYDSALAIAGKYKFKYITAKAHQYIGHTHLRQNKFDLATTHLQKALEIFSEEKNQFDAAGVINLLGETFLNQKNTDEAIQTFEQALEINQKNGNVLGEAENQLNLAICYLKLGNYQKAKNSLDSGFPLAKHSGVDELVKRYYQNFITICESNGMHAESHDYFNKYLAISEKINHSNFRNLTDLLIKYYENGLQNEKQMFDNEIEIKNLAAEKNKLHLRQMIYISVIVLGLALIIIFLYINKFLSARKLEKIVEERTHVIRENEQKLIESAKTQDKLYSIIAHDLKSPFNSLLGFANLLHEEYDEFADEERKKYINIMRSSSEEIFFLLENLLEWTRNSLEDIHYKPFRLDLNKTTKQSIALVEKNATLKNISIRNEIPKNTFVYADENMVRTILRNLLSNAIKFTHTGGEIIIDSSLDNDFITCSVTDNGIGISPENISKLFKVDSTIRKKGTSNERGTGLGLALCKEFVEKNGGNISVESEPEKGSKFVFTLPVK